MEVPLAQVRVQSEANTRTFNYLGKKRDRETPFLEGAPNGEVYLYSSQKFNCCELQKARESAVWAV